MAAAHTAAVPVSFFKTNIVFPPPGWYDASASYLHHLLAGRVAIFKGVAQTNLANSIYSINLFCDLKFVFPLSDIYFRF